MKLRTIFSNAMVWLPTTIILYTGYQGSNRFHWRTPMYLPLTEFDQAIPFLAWTIWPYNLLMLLLLLPLFIREKSLFRLTLTAYVISCCLNLLIWTFWPTVYPRVVLPEGQSLTLSTFHWLHAIDTPANCFPSGHITSPAVGCWALAREQVLYRKWIWSGFALLSLTILTTKQHYAIDLVGGLMSAGIGIVIATFLYDRTGKKALLAPIQESQ